MKRKTIDEMWDDFRRECIELSKLDGQWCAYVSGSKTKRNKFNRLIEKYRKNIDIDLQLGIIGEEQKDSHLKVYEIMKKSMEFYKEYGYF